jgi:hypothetical protein
VSHSEATDAALREDFRTTFLRAMIHAMLTADDRLTLAEAGQVAEATYRERWNDLGEPTPTPARSPQGD